ncbi:MurR/RpiR family transcriptional regulator [Streptacidiphilus sp. MAP12-33]|uniref:MurR/RpiR family transcriptional regulator n=1 Tax=Streptacidiphilus sp. MAP12-33 TaxID=3156266 RepID=UPI003517B2CA
MPSVPPAPEALEARARAVEPQLTEAMAAVVALVVGDPADCAGLTVGALAARAGTSEATVVRTARLLGYPGYRALRLALAGLAARRAASAPALTGDIAVDDPIADVIAKLAHEERQSLADTAAQLSPQALAAAVDSVAEARRVEIFGVGASGLVGQDLMQKLLRIGLVAGAAADPHLAMTAAVHLRPGDVAVAVTNSGETREVLEPLRRAREAGATTVVLTSRPGSRAARLADRLLLSSAGREMELRPAAMASRSSQLLVVDCLCIGVVQRRYTSAQPALAATYRALVPRRSAPGARTSTPGSGTSGSAAPSSSAAGAVVPVAAARAAAARPGTEIPTPTPSTKRS